MPCVVPAAAFLSLIDKVPSDGEGRPSSCLQIARRLRE